MPVFSIIIPIYKTEKFIKKCIDSVLNQSFRDFELILVDDGSTDTCAEICDQYLLRDSRIRIVHKPNGGVSSARNIALSLVRGQYVWFVDSDDYIELYALDQLYKAQSEQCADLYIFNTKGLNEFSECTFDEFLERYYFRYVVGFGPWNKLYRSNLIWQYDLKFDIEETIGEDLLFNLSYYNAMFKVGGVSVKCFFTLAETTTNMLIA